MRPRLPLPSLLLLTGVAVVSCTPALPSTHDAMSGVPAITGQVADLAVGRTAQATIYDVAQGATVSLIDTTTGQTVASTVTSASGAFSLNFDKTFHPGNQPYYMEAVKGLPVGGNANRAGAAAARVRTIVYFNQGWTSLTGATPNSGVVLGTATTALCDIVSLRNLSAANLVGSLNGTTFTPPGGSAIAQTEYGTVWSLAQSLLAADEDPVAAIVYDPTRGQPYYSKPGNLVIFDRYTVNGAPSPATASQTAPYNAVTFYGQNFPTDPSTASVALGPVPVATWSVNASRTQLNVTLGSANCGGNLLISQGQSTWTGPFIGVRGTVGTMAGSGFQAYTDGRGTSAQFLYPRSLVANSSGTLFMTDMYANVIRKITPTGVVSTFAGNGAAVTADGTGTNASFYNPSGLVIDSSNNMYVSELNGSVRKVTPAGVVTTLLNAGPSYTFQGLAYNEATGVIYLTASNQIWTLSGGTLSYLAGNPSGAPGSSNGATSSASFNNACSIALDGAGNLYVGDRYNAAIRKVTPAGVVSTFSPVDSPGMITRDAAGNFYNPGAGNHVIQKISPTGVVTALAGGVYGYLDGATSSAQFCKPMGALAANGNVYVTTISDYRLRVVTP